VPTTDLSCPGPFLDSKRRSRARRAEARRQLRRLRGRRSAIAVLGASLVLAGGAIAQSGGGASGAAAKSSVRGAGVVALQQALGIPADGIYGPQTRGAVIAFQRAHGLMVDGIAGPQTLGALGLSASPSAAPASASSGTSATLQQIAQCESSGNPAAVSADGRYRGKYQFSRATWRAMGGTGDPAAAPESVQDAMAAKLLAQRGTSPWPNCA
jgi:peptidoglycan hydrolase-like protein with peptidoglycan-binding domain